MSGGGGRGIAGVQIRFDTGQRVVTDSKGRFEVEGLAWGERPVILVSSRCAVTSATVVVSETDRRLYEAGTGLPRAALPNRCSSSMVRCWAVAIGSCPTWRLAKWRRSRS
jgi:hypothetical protein